MVILWFILGMMVGGFLGIMVMAMLIGGRSIENIRYDGDKGKDCPHCKKNIEPYTYR